MHRHLIAGALACFGSSLFGQSTDNPVTQTQGPLNKIENTLQNGIQSGRDAVDRTLQQSSGSSVLGDGSNRSSLGVQNQVDGSTGLPGNAGVQSNTNLRTNVDGQSAQLNSNLSTQGQGQSTLGSQQRGNGSVQDPSDQYGNSYQPNGNSGFQSQSIQRQGQPMQGGVLSNQSRNPNVIQNSGSMQNRPQTQMGSSVPADNMQQSWSSQNAGRVYVLRFDANGREFICVDGRPVYFENVNSNSSQGNAWNQNQNQNQNQFRSGYGNYDLKNGQNSQGPSRETYQLKNQQQTFGSGQNSSGYDNSSRSVDPSNSRETTKGKSDAEVSSPASDRARSNIQSESKALQNDVDSQTDFNAKSDVIKPSNGSTEITPPKL